MSGGSFDYLHQSSPAGLFTENRRDDLRRMAEELRKLGHEDAAVATETLLLLIEDSHKEIEQRADLLNHVWHAAEWNRSGDWNEGDVRGAVEKWRHLRKRDAKPPVGKASSLPAFLQPLPSVSITDMESTVRVDSTEITFSISVKSAVGESESAQ